MSALTVPNQVAISLQRSVTGSRVGAIVRIIALLALFCAAPVYEARHASAVTAPELWVHLRIGEWILQTRSVPHAGIFSQFPNLLWKDSSWGFDLILAETVKVFGVQGIPIFLMVLKLALALATFLLARAGRAQFWSAVALSALAQYVIPGLQPLPYVCSILFFAVELWLLLRTRYSGDVRLLFWLPLLFVVWANLHVQFVFGLVLLGLFLAAAGMEQGLRSLGVRWIDRRVVQSPLKSVVSVSGLSLLATFLTPYTFHLLPQAFTVLYSPVAFEHFAEMTSMSYRRPQEFVFMLLVMSAFLALGRRRSLALFEMLALLGGTLIAFRIQRDSWVAVLPAVALLSEGLFGNQRKSDESTEKGRPWEFRFGILAVAAVVGIAALIVPGPQALMEKTSQYFPLKACDYIRANHLSQPLFNAYIWGDFLTWYLPEYPVVVDSRIDLYGNERAATYFDIVGGKKRLEEEPLVAGAGTLLLERESAMARALTNMPALTAEYRLVYSDDISSVFIPIGHDR